MMSLPEIGTKPTTFEHCHHTYALWRNHYFRHTILNHKKEAEKLFPQNLDFTLQITKESEDFET